MKRGVELARYYAAEALRLIDAVPVGDDLRQAEQLHLWLAAKAKNGQREFPLRAVYTFGPAGIRDAQTARAALKILEDHGHVVRMRRGVR